MFFYVSAFCSHSERVLRIFLTPFWHLVDGIMELGAVSLALLVHLFPIYLFVDLGAGPGGPEWREPD